LIRWALRIISAGALVSAALLPGCASSMYWGAFEESAERNIEIERQRDADDPIPDPLEPEFADGASLPTPEDGKPLSLSIEQAAVFALRNNRDLQVQQLNPVIAGTFEAIERGVFDPEVFANLDFARERVSETARATGEQFDVVGEDTSALGGIRQTLPTGTEIEATIEEDRTSSDRAPEQQEARIGLTITQSLLEGFGPAVNLASVRQAELDTEASVYQLRGFTEALLADVEIAYWNYELALEEIAIFEQSLEIAKQQRDQVEQRIEVGVLAETEAAAARTEVAIREQALIDARSTLRARQLELLRLINPDREGRLDLEIESVSEPRIDASPLENTEERLRLADRRRPDLNEARLRLEQGRLETMVTRNGLLPRLDVFISLGKSGFATTLPDAFQELDSDSYDFSAGVSFSQMLGNQAARGRDVAAREIGRASWRERV